MKVFGSNVSLTGSLLWIDNDLGTSFDCMESFLLENPFSVMNDWLEDLLADGFKNKWFSETAMLGSWAEQLNCDLVIAKAETQINQVLEAIKSSPPRAILLGGSDKMLSLTHQTDAVVIETLKVVKEALEKEIPLLGICFGAQMLLWERFKLMVNWLWTLPSGKPGCLYGSHRVDWYPESNWLSEASGMKRSFFALKLHSQGLLLEDARDRLPPTAVLAVSKPSELAGKEVIEVVDCGARALAISGHPEMSARSFLAYSCSEWMAQSLQEQGPLSEVWLRAMAYDSCRQRADLLSLAWLKMIL